MTDFAREIKVTASYDHRDEPDSQRGAHGAELVLILRGPLGAIAARIMTGWMTHPLTASYVSGHEQERRRKPGVDNSVIDVYPSGAYVGSHTYVPREFSDANGPCDWLGTAVCYGDGSYTAADEILELLVSGGSDAAFERLEELYQSWIADRAEVAQATP